jgi:hypothetical protein
MRARLVDGMARPVASADADAERVQIDLLRAAGTARRAALALSLSRSVIALARDAIRRRHPELSEQDVGLAFVELNYGSELAARLRRHLCGPA